MQTKLRQELQSVNTDTPTMEELNALPYLDAVVRETLRVHAVVGSTIRIAIKDDVIPVSTPYKDAQGNLRHEIKCAPLFIYRIC
jgi:cytochrome P450